MFPTAAHRGPDASWNVGGLGRQTRGGAHFVPKQLVRFRAARERVREQQAFVAAATRPTGSREVTNGMV